MTAPRVGKPLIEFIELRDRRITPPFAWLVGLHGVGVVNLFSRPPRKPPWASSSSAEIYRSGTARLDGPSPARRDGNDIPPAFLPTEGKGLLVFEELNRCPSFVRAPCLQLLTARCLNDYSLPSGWLPAAAINPADGDDYEVFELDGALLSRFVQATVVPDQELWLQWAQQNEVHPGVISYVASDHSIFADCQSNPRAWKYVSDLLNASERAETAHEILRTAVIGLVGNKRGSAFLGFLQQGLKPLAAKDILADYRRHRHEVVNWISNGKLDLVRGSLLAALKSLQTRPNYRSARESRTQWRNLGAFLSDLPGDLFEEAQGFFLERDYELPKTRG